MVIHSDGGSKLTCELCNQKFLRTKTYQRHMAKHQKKYNCKFCSATFNMEAKLNSHMNSHDPAFKTR